jgi:ABC-type sugar transport system substrate-binding protein
MDGKAVVPVLKKAQAANIPVVWWTHSVEKGNEACTSPTSAPTTSTPARRRRAYGQELGGKATF